MSDEKKSIEKHFLQSAKLLNSIATDKYVSIIYSMGQLIANSIEDGGKLMLCGNGGSAADAQHLAAELLVRLRPKVNRQGIPAIALAMDSSTMTACGNDFGFEMLYERMVDTLGQKNDVLLVITTSGRSSNVIGALKKAQSKGILTLGFLGAGGGPAMAFCDFSFVAPSDDTALVQESHIAAGHALMITVEDLLLAKDIIKEGSLSGEH